jgi:hypothetical protein
MGLIGINQPSNPTPKRNLMDEIATGVQMATNILGTGIKGYEAYTSGKKNMAEADLYDQRKQDYLAPYYMLANKDNNGKLEKGAHMIPGGGDQYYVPRQEESYLNQGIRLTNTNDDKIENDVRKLRDSLDVNKISTRSGVGQAVRNYNAAVSAEALLAPHMQNPDAVTPQQFYEISRNLDRITSQGNATLGGAEHLLPRSLWGDLSAIKNYFTNQAGGANMGDFVKNFYQAIEREKAVNDGIVNGEIKRRMAGEEGSRLQKLAPNRFNDIIAEFKDQLYHLPDNTMPQINPNIGKTAPRAGDVEDGHRFKGGNPADPNNWELIK